MADKTTSVEDALAELREMFPDRDSEIFLAASHQATEWEIKLHGKPSRNGVSAPTWFTTPTLNEAMDQVRQWHADQGKESKG